MFALKGGLRFVLVTVGIIVLTSIGIDASQYLSGAPSALGILADHVTEGTCPTGMVFIEAGTEDFCIDAYEATPNPECLFNNPGYIEETAANIRTPECVPQSNSEGSPWVYVTYHQARELCAKAGKRLPSNAEWYTAALGTTEANCKVMGETVVRGGGSSDCRSAAGVYNMIGNAWEWVDARVARGDYDGRRLPETGFVSNADTDGVALETGADPSAGFHHDYFWSDSSGETVMMRGGFFGSGEDAGLYSVHAAVAPNFASPATGFRCVRNI